MIEFCVSSPAAPCFGMGSLICKSEEQFTAHSWILVIKIGWEAGSSLVKG